jgi:hypothetical protein
MSEKEMHMAGQPHDPHEDDTKLLTFTVNCFTFYFLFFLSVFCLVVVVSGCLALLLLGAWVVCCVLGCGLMWICVLVLRFVAGCCFVRELF